MPRATVTPKYVNGPKGEGNYGSIKTGDGTYYSFDTRKIRVQDFNRDQAVTVEFNITEKGDKTYYNITRIVPDDAPQASNGNHAPSGDGPRPTGGSRMSPEESERVTRLAIAKSCIEAGKDTRDAEHWLSWVRGTQAPQPQRHIDPGAPF